MPRKSKAGSAYPTDWPQIATAIKEAAGWRCIRCDHPHDPASGYTLTVHHADLDPSNCRWWNLLALCQRCHLQIQHKVNLDRPWVMQEHTPWFRPYVAGFYAHKYLGADLSREVVEARIDELLLLERRAVLGVAS